ncbi:MAG: NUDIX hydrolase [Clostridiales bacterium]|nr:NUDIX hydrolase [Clostridiales bacterium]
MAFFEKTIDTKRVYEGKIVNIRTDTVELCDGKHALREVVEHPGGVVILPVDEALNVYTVRQFRYPFMKEMLEAPAGKLERGENPYDCAVRELEEETGLTAEKMIGLGQIFTSPGFCEEVLHLFLATGLHEGKPRPDEGEFLSVEKCPLDTLIEQIMAGTICDAKTIAAVFKAKEYLKNKTGGYFCG